MTTYAEFLASKVVAARDHGFEVRPQDAHASLKPHQRDVVCWNVKGGRRANFCAFGLGKTRIQLETLRLIRARGDGDALIVCPLGVRQEFRLEAENIGLATRFIRSLDEIDAPGQLYVDGESRPIYITNYETIRDGKLDPKHFAAVSLDEADVLRGFGGSKTFREFMRLFDGVRFKFVATATPSPNEYIELLAYAAFLEVMDVGEAKTRFFKRNAEKADELTIHPHKEAEFWAWVSTWAVFVQRPSDLGYSDEGYELPPLDVRWHEIPSDHSGAVPDRDGQQRLFRDASLGVVQASREKRDSLDARLAKLLEIRAEEPDEHRIIWHDLEAERDAIERAIPTATSVYGAQDLEAREQAIVDFSAGKFAELAAKPVLAGAGCNFQRHCARAVFLGIGFKFRDFWQAIHRINRFLQTRPVRIDIIYTEAEREVRATLERKWAQHLTLVEKLTALIREHGLANLHAASSLCRSMGVTRREECGERFRVVHNDCVAETATMADASVDLILTSIPFSTQYEYSPNYADFGHTDSNEHFFGQMDYLTRELVRVLKPGRVAAIHVKDRIVPGGLTGLGFQTVYPFHAKCIEHFTSHGFAYMGMKTIVTDVVRENNQTYRLGWTEQCKDATKMGVGMPEYLLLFRRPPTSNEKSYADTPVVKSKEKYSRGRWQVDAHAFARSSGNRPLLSSDLAGVPHATIFKLFRKYSLSQVYDFEQHVRLAEDLDAAQRLPVTFMLLQPQSWMEDVWSDVTRMRTLNASQYAKGKEMHLCPMQFDIADRVIEQFSMEGESVFDPFGGIGTVPARAVQKKRFGIACELSAAYFVDMVGYCRAAERELAVPDLFALDDAESLPAEIEPKTESAA